MYTFFGFADSVAVTLRLSSLKVGYVYEHALAGSFELGASYQLVMVDPLWKFCLLQLLALDAAGRLRTGDILVKRVFRCNILQCTTC
jgi:hypothetical protein